MGMFDYYELGTKLKCPNCKTELEGWQGKDGPNELLVWKQGYAKPIELPSFDDNRIVKFAHVENDDICGLPETFKIHTICQKCDAFIKAVGKCKNGVWNSTTNVQVSE